MQKFCRQCEKHVAVSGYYRKPESADGLQSICKACHRENMRVNRAVNRDRIIANERERNAKPHRIAARKAYRVTPAGRESKANEKVRSPIKYAAREAVRRAVRSGRLTRQPCEVCGAAKAQAHHDDYGKPLDVRWLCTTHHAAWHKENDPVVPEEKAA